MTVTPSSIDLKALLEKEVLQASPDLIRELLQIFINTLLSAEADAVCGAEYGARDASRSNRRNGYRHRELDTRAGTIDVAVPKLREGSYFPDWLLERKKRAERALTSVVATCYLLGVSTRRMDKLVGSLGITSLSKSQVSDMAAELDEQVEAFRTRPLDAGPYTLVAADAMVIKVREHGRVINVHALIATGVNSDGYREILGVQVTSAEDGAGWLSFFRDLVARGLSGVKLVTSDAHPGLKAAVAATLPGAAWQRCRTHYAVNLMSITPKQQWPAVRALLQRIIIETLHDLDRRGVNIKSLTEPMIDTTTPMGRALFGMVAVFAQLRVDTIRENTMRGLAHAKSQGRVGGRPAKMTPEKIAQAKRMRAENASLDHIAGVLSVGKSTVARALARLEDDSEQVTAGASSGRR